MTERNRKGWGLGGGAWLEIDSRYPLSRAASLLWPHLPIKPQAPMKIMTKRATLRPKELWDVTVRLPHDLQALQHKCTSTHTHNVHTLERINHA